MKVRILMAGVALLGTVAAPMRQDAPYYPCEHRRAGRISTSLAVNPLSFEVSGTGFTPGGLVHIELISTSYVEPTATPTVTATPSSTPSFTVTRHLCPRRNLRQPRDPVPRRNLRRPAPR